MPQIIGVPRETRPGERRVAITPEVTGKFRALGVEVCLEQGAGADSYFSDSDFNANVIARSAAGLFGVSNIILKVLPPTLDEIRLMRPGTVLAGFLHPFEDPERARLLCERGITSLAVELIPRISRAQSMDALTSQATIAGYQVALIAAVIAPRFFPMITYAAGSLRPARVLVLGAGVAGLQAIATAHRLGAVVEAYDVRPETREQVESLGARFVDTGISAVGPGGYARELTTEERKTQQERLAKAVSQADVLITTAAVPGRKSPLLVTEEMTGRMKKGAVIVDMASENGGNVAGSRPGETVVKDGVTIRGTMNLASRMPVHASEMYSRNLFNLLSPFIRNGELVLDWNDDVLSGCVFTRDNRIVNEAVRKVLEGGS